MLTQNRRTLKAREVIRHLGELLQRQEAISADRSALAEFVRWDSEFHLTIVESLENAELSKIFSSHLYCIQKHLFRAFLQRMFDFFLQSLHCEL